MISPPTRGFCLLFFSEFLMAMTSQNTLEFLAGFLALPGSNEKKWLSFQSFCDAFMEKTLLPSLAPCKPEVRTALSGVLRRIHLMSVFPEFAGRKVICRIGFPASQKEQRARLLGSIPEISLKDARVRVFNTVGAGLEMRIPQILRALRNLSGKDDSTGTLFSARLIPNEKLSPYVAYITLAEGCSPETTFFKEFLEIADDIILAPASSDLQKATLSYLQAHRPNVSIWIGNAREHLFRSSEAPIRCLRFKKGYPANIQQEASFTSFSFLFQWALQPVTNWIAQQKNELAELEKLLTSDLVMVNSDDLEESIKEARGYAKSRLDDLLSFEKDYLIQRRELLDMAGELDSDISSRSVSFSPSIDDWARAEAHLLRLLDSGCQQLPELRQHIDSLRQGGYPHECILNCAEAVAMPEAYTINSEITLIDRPVAHRLCIRLRHKLGITDAEAGHRHAMSLYCESADEWYVRGIALIETNVRAAEKCLRRALDLGRNDAGKLLHKNLSLMPLYHEDRGKTENFLLKALVPEMCFEKAMRSKEGFLRRELFLLYISAAQSYIPAIRAVASLERKKSNSKKCSDDEKNMHRKQAMALYEYLEQSDSLSSTEYFWLGSLFYAERRFKEAMSYFMKSEDARAVRLIGRMYQYGDGVEIDYIKAQQHYHSAVTKGDQIAKDLLNKIKQRETSLQNKSIATTQGDYREQRSYSSSSSSSGICFLTTATCRVMGYEDDCDVLQAYRCYRDDILRKDEDGPDLIRQYYEVAPEILRQIDASQNPMSVYSGMWKEYLLPGYQLLLEKRYPEAKKLYIKLVTSLMEQFGPKI